MGVVNPIKYALLFCVSLIPVFAQLAPFNDSGVTMGHMHLAVKDVDAQKQFWVSMMGGTLVKSGPLELIQFPGIYIMLRKAEPTGPPEGTTVNHFGFVVKDLAAYKSKWAAAGVGFKPNENPNAGYVSAPDGIRIEIFGDPNLPVPIQMDHVHFFLADFADMKAWYVKTFGAAPSERKSVSSVKVLRMIETGNFPGKINFSFAPAAGGASVVGTKGRSIDHIGFELKDLDAFAKKAEAQGIKFDVAPRGIPNAKTRIAFLTDPWGTYIEVTEALAPAN